MKITGNEQGKKLDDSLTSTADIEALAESNALTEKMFFDSLETSVRVKEVDFNDGKFEVQVEFSELNIPPTISISIDNIDLSKDLFVNSATSADNREGVLQFIKAGVLSAITNSFSMETFGDHLQILDEKLKSKTLEIQQADIGAGSLHKVEEVPQLVTSLDFEKDEKEEAFTVSEVDPVKETTEADKLEARGYDMTSMDDDEPMPENYKPLSDGTTDNLTIIEEDKEPVEDGSFENIGKISH